MKKLLLLPLSLCVLSIFILVLAYISVFRGSLTFGGFVSFTRSFMRDPGLSFLAVLPGTEQNRVMKELSEGSVFDVQTDVPTTHEQFLSFVGSVDSVDSVGWIWSTDFFVGNVVGVDVDDQLLGVDFLLPKGRDNPAVIQVYCSSEDTIIVSPEWNILSEAVNFFESVKRGSRLYAYCLDADCVAVGKSCVLIQ